MKTSLRPVILMLVLILMLGGAALWCANGYLQSRAAVESAAEQLADVRQLAEQVKLLRDRPVLAGAQEMELTDLAQMLERAVDQANIERGQLDRIWPEAARRVAESDYLEKPTQVVLRRVSLEQLLRFTHAIGGRGDRGLTISAMRLIAPRESERGGRSNQQGWTAELTVSYLIYAPRERRAAAQGE